MSEPADKPTDKAVDAVQAVQSVVTLPVSVVERLFAAMGTTLESLAQGAHRDAGTSEAGAPKEERSADTQSPAQSERTAERSEPEPDDKPEPERKPNRKHWLLG